MSFEQNQGKGLRLTLGGVLECRADLWVRD